MLIGYYDTTAMLAMVEARSGQDQLRPGVD
jgi:hypothetical protein